MSSGRPAILILAAGASARMRGRDKLVEPVDGRPLLAGRVAAAEATGALVLVALPPAPEAPARHAALAGTGALAVPVAGRGEGMAASLRAGIAALPAGCPSVTVLPADMPEITTADLAALLARADGTSILRGATAAGEPGHPVLFPAADFAALAALSGDVGAREILRAAAARVRLVALPGRAALTDLDTPEDWAAWRARGQT